MQDLIRLLLQEQSDLGLHCFHMQFCQVQRCTKFFGHLPYILFENKQKKPKHLGSQVLNASDFASQGPGFESCCRQNSAHDCMALHDTEPFIIILPLSLNDLNNVEKDKKTPNHYNV